MATKTGGSGMTPPRAWEALLRRTLPEGSVGRSILGDLREEHARRAGESPSAADHWYRTEAISVAVRAIRNRLLGKWSGEPRLGPRRGGEGRGDPVGEKMLRSLRYGVGSLVRTPRYTIVAIFTLALGIGANTAIFSVVNGVLLQPLPFPDSQALVQVSSTAPGLNYNRFPQSPANYFSFRDESPAFTDMGVYRRTEASLTGDGNPEDVEAVVATHTLFSTLGVEASLGRTFSADEDQPSAPPTVVISHGLWGRRFGSDRTAVGKTTDINGELHEIIGVMPPRFDFPRDVELWLPARLDSESPPGSFSYPIVGRLAEGVTAAQAQAQLTPLVERIIQSYPEGSDWREFMVNGRYAPVVLTLKEEMVGSLEQPLWVLLGTVGFVLLIACTNVANLVLVRVETRRREFAVRAALGATKGSLIRQSLTESTLLALAGGAIGLLVAWVGVPVVLSQAPPQLPRLSEVDVDTSVLLFTLGATALSVFLFGAAPLLRLSPSALLTTLRQGGRGSTPGPRGRRSRVLLAAGQTALALVLMVGSGLLVRSFWQVYRTDLGFRYENLLTFRVSLPESRYPTPTLMAAYHEEALERLRALPGVEDAGLTSAMPVADRTGASPFELTGHTVEGGQSRQLLDYKYVSTGYAETLGIRVVAGRTFEEEDSHNGMGTVLVDQTLATRYWPGEDPIGKQLRFAHDPAQWYTVTGVLGSVLEAGVRIDPKPMVFFPLVSPVGDEGWSVPSAAFVIRTENPEAIARSVQSAVWSMDPDIPLAGVRTGEEIVAESVVRLSFTMVTLGLAAALAVVLGAVGLYGVLSYSVAQRRQEIAVHMALGAEQREVMRMVVGDGAKITGLGIVLGLGGAWALTRLLQTILFGIEALDLLTFGGMAGGLFSVALLAAYLPARRAATVDPVESMRAD